MGLIKFMVSIMMVGLFSVALVMFAFNFQADNNAAVLLVDDPDLVGINTNIRGNLSAFRSSANSSSEAFFEQTEDAGDQSASSGGQHKVGIKDSISITTTAMNAGWKKILGEDNEFGIFLSALSAILVWLGAMWGYKAWRGKNPD